jgi:hypothetical protein
MCSVSIGKNWKEERKKQVKKRQGLDIDHRYNQQYEPELREVNLLNFELDDVVQIKNEIENLASSSNSLTK